MDWVSDAIDAFGNSAGIRGLRFDEDGCISLALGEGRLVTIVDSARDGDGPVVVALRAPMGFPQSSIARAALRFADFRQATSVPPQIAVEGDNLVATLRIERRSFLASTLQEAISNLLEFHDRARHRGAAA
jgi:type III secretion system chaperone SycN